MEDYLVYQIKKLALKLNRTPTCFEFYKYIGDNSYIKEYGGYHKLVKDANLKPNARSLTSYCAYDTYDNYELVTLGNKYELAKYFKVKPQTIVEYGRIHKKIKNRFIIEKEVEDENN